MSQPTIPTQFVVLDSTVIDEYLAGKPGVNNQLKDLFFSGAHLYVTRSNYNRLALVDSTRRMITIFRISAPINDSYAETVSMRRRVVQNNPRNADRTSAALVLNLGDLTKNSNIPVRLMTANRAQAQDFEIMMNADAVIRVQPNFPPDPNHIIDDGSARRRFQQSPENIRGGVVTFAPPRKEPLDPWRKPDPTREQVRVNGQSWGPRPDPLGSRGNYPERARTEQPDKVDKSTQTTWRARARENTSAMEGGARLFFQGVNFVVQAINDRVQAQRMAERWAVSSPGVAATLSLEPTLGALVRVYFYKQEKMGSENDSPVDHVTVFKDIRIAYGMTREDALVNFSKRDQINVGDAGNLMIDDSMFIAPKLPVDFSKLSSPFPAEGVATFIPGMEAFLNIRWAGWNRSFQKTGETNFKLGAMLEAIQFLYLSPPEEIGYKSGGTGKYEAAEIDWDYVSPGEIGGHLGTHFPGLPSVDTSNWTAGINLDALKNKNRALFAPRGVMIFPVNATTANLFSLHRTLWDDHGELLANYPTLRRMIRFVHPARLRVLRYFGA